MAGKRKALADDPQIGLGLATGAPDFARLKKHNAWFTPQGSTLYLLRTLRDDFGLRPRRWKDPQAGGGVFGWAGAQVWMDAYASAVEIREEEEGNLSANYDAHEIADYLASPAVADSEDAIVTNPSFDDALPVADKALRELRVGGILALLLRLTWGDNAQVSAWMREHPPVGCIELDGRLQFAVGVNPESGKPFAEDSVTYRMLIWRRGGGRLTPRGAIDYERYIKTPRLPDKDRTWLLIAGQAVRPGTEHLFHEAA